MRIHRNPFDQKITEVVIKRPLFPTTRIDLRIKHIRKIKNYEDIPSS
jgi:hypothetical protein